MMKYRIPLLLGTLLLAVAIALYMQLSAPDYGDINADGLKLGQQAYDQKDYAEAAKWFRLGAKKGGKQAQYLFAMLYRDGQGVDRDDVQAVYWLKLAAAQKYTRAQYQLATMLEHGRGVDQADVVAAAKWYRKAAVSGDAGAALHLAMLYAEGQGVKKNDAEALDWAVKSSEAGNREAVSYLHYLLNRITLKASAGDPAAQFVLARMYEQGHGLNADIKQAEQWLRHSAASGNAEAQFQLAELLLPRKQPQSLQEAADLYLKAARQGNMQAAGRIGTLYATAQGIERDTMQALEWLKKAANSGLSQAQGNLGIMLAEAGDDQQAIDWLSKAASSGVAAAQNNLAVMLMLGRGGKKDMRGGLKWIKAAAESDHLAQYNLGFMYLRGVGVLQDEDAAAGLLKKAQSGGGLRAKLLLGLLYDRGRGVISNDGDAARWYQQAAALGSADAVVNLAALYYRKEKFKKAFALFVTAANAGDAQSKNIVASMYQQGQGTAFDMRQSIQWYKKAARDGYAPAQFNLANLYRKGNGMDQQDKQAVHWYRMAAKQGFAPAQNALAYMYAQGRGVKPDRNQAMEWLKKAASQGSKTAEHNLSLLQQKQSGFVLINLVVDIQPRTGILSETPFDLAHRLQIYHRPQLY